MPKLGNKKWKGKGSKVKGKSNDEAVSGRSENTATELPDNSPLTVSSSPAIQQSSAQITDKDVVLEGRTPPASKAYSTLFRCYESLQCRRCTTKLRTVAFESVYIYQYALYCSLDCLQDSFPRQIDCSQCEGTLDVAKTRHSFSSATGAIQRFCTQVCFTAYTSEALLCTFCCAPVPSTFYSFPKSNTRFCNAHCLSRCAFTGTSDDAHCLTCQKPSHGRPIPSILAHGYSPQSSEHWCSFKCKLEYAFPLGSTMEDSRLNELSLNLENLPNLCVICCRRFDRRRPGSVALYGHGKEYLLCGNVHCTQDFRMLSRTLVRCTHCQMCKFNCDSIEMVKPHAYTPLIRHFCSMTCVAAVERPITLVDPIIRDSKMSSTLTRACLWCKHPLHTQNPFYCSPDCRLKNQTKRLVVRQKGKVFGEILDQDLLSPRTLSFGTQTNYVQDVLPLLDLAPGTVMPSLEGRDRYQSRIKTVYPRLLRPLFFPLPVIIPIQSVHRDVLPLLLCPLNEQVFRHLLNVYLLPRNRSSPVNVQLVESFLSLLKASRPSLLSEPSLPAITVSNGHITPTHTPTPINCDTAPPPQLNGVLINGDGASQLNGNGASQINGDSDTRENGHNPAPVKRRRLSSQRVPPLESRNTLAVAETKPAYRIFKSKAKKQNGSSLPK